VQAVLKDVEARHGPGRDDTEVSVMSPNRLSLAAESRAIIVHAVASFNGAFMRAPPFDGYST